MFLVGLQRTNIGFRDHSPFVFEISLVQYIFMELLSLFFFPFNATLRHTNLEKKNWKGLVRRDLEGEIYGLSLCKAKNRKKIKSYKQIYRDLAT